MHHLKVQSSKLYNNKYMIVLKQITNTKIFAFIAFLVFKLLSGKFIYKIEKKNRNGLKIGYFLRNNKFSV